MRVRAAVTGILVVAAVIHFHALDRAPVFIGWDEARFALQGHAIATTGRDLNGHTLPLFFHNTDPLIPNHSSRIWWQPVLIYLIAAVLRVAPLSVWAVRLPTAGLALLDIGLMYLIARRLFGDWKLAVLAAAMLALTPAHVIFGRMASDYFCPVPFTLLWLWLLLVTVQTERRAAPFATGLVLGVGFFCYVAAWIIMPFLLAVTTVVLWWSGQPLRRGAAIVAGFAVPLLALIPWISLHPEMPRDMFLGYAVKTSVDLSRRVALYWDYFNPSFLFFSGGSELMWATRRAGIFLLGTAVLLPGGLWSIWRHTRSVERSLLLVGFFFAPVPIVLALPEDPAYATARDLLVVPFGVLIAVAGVEWLIAEGGRAGRWIALLVLFSMPVQFVAFARDYFGDYQRRSAYRMDSANIGAAASTIIAMDRSAPVPAIYLSPTLGTGKSVQWKFHLATRQREDLWQRTRYLDFDRVDDIVPGSLLIIEAGNPRLDALVRGKNCSIVETVNSVTNEPVAEIVRRD